MCAACRSDDVGQQAAGLGREAEVERQIKQHSRQPQRHAESQHIQQALPRPAFETHPQQAVCQDEKRTTQQNIPNIQEGHAAQHEGRGQKTRQADPQICTKQLQVAAPSTQEEVQGNGHGQQDERDSQDMRMQVRVQERKEREFVDDLAGRARQIVVGNNPGGPPPPPEPVRDPCQWLRWCLVQILDVQPGPEVACAAPKPAVPMQHLQESFQVADDQHKERCQQSRARGSIRFHAAYDQQVEQQAIRADGSQREDERRHQVMCNAAGDPGELRQHGGHHVAKVVVRNRITRKPAIMGRKARRAQHGVDEHQLHRLLGIVEGRIPRT